MIDSIDVAPPENAEQANEMVHRASCIVGLVARYLDDQPNEVCSMLVSQTLFAAEDLLTASCQWRNEQERAAAARKVRS